MKGKAFLVDTTKCTGCRACQVMCKQWNNLPAEDATFFGGPEYTNPASLSAVTFNHVIFFPIDRNNPKKPIWTMMHKKCYHCEEANCMKACPEEAISKKEGWTVIDQSKCVGCGACRNACIYNVPHVLLRVPARERSAKTMTRDRAYKCDACMANRRNVPTCAAHCPTGALSYGNRDELLARAKARVAQVRADFPQAGLYGEKEFGGLRVITILKEHPDKFGLPLQPVPLDVKKAEAVRDTYHLLSLFTFGLPSLKRVAYRVSRSLVG